MKKNTILGCFLMFSLLTYSQNGINTINPQGVLHVDGAKDNASTGAPTTIQQQNDFIVTKTGNLGIGTTTPVEKVDVVGNVQFTGTLNPNGSTGTTGQVLTSQGASSSPTWVTTAIVPVIATVKCNTALDFANNTRVPLEFNIIEQDNFAGVKITDVATPAPHDKEDKIVISQDGDYLIQCQFGFAGGQIFRNGIVVLLIKEVGTTRTELQIMQAPAAGENNTYVNLVGVHNLKKGDKIMVFGQQSNGDTRPWIPGFFRFSVAKM